MQGFDCNASTGAHNRCAGDGFSYCVRFALSNVACRLRSRNLAGLDDLKREANALQICAPLANGVSGDPQGLYENSAWDLDPYGCTACQGQARGAITDGTCRGNGNQPAPHRPGYIATVTVVVDPNGRPVQTVIARPGGSNRSRRASIAFIFAWSFVSLALSSL